ncbi:hypothetical protein XENOCAPTIV_016970 [Xenoophorus captivus]|uniref:Uncharacterized protein n=1 Tax=Xenoophorus captivus TaxID=1517983 RepID=A0ABV0QAD4_9TELE
MASSPSSMTTFTAGTKTGFFHFVSCQKTHSHLSFSLSPLGTGLHHREPAFLGQVTGSVKQEHSAEQVLFSGIWRNRQAGCVNKNKRKDRLKAGNQSFTMLKCQTSEVYPSIRRFTRKLWTSNMQT